MGSRSLTFRESVQPLVRETAVRGGSVNELAHTLRTSYGRAYRRTDMLADLRAYRDSARSVALRGTRDLRRLIAHAGVAVFSMTLVLPATLRAPSAPVLVASVTASPVPVASEVFPQERIALPNARATPEPTPEPTPVPTPVPTPPPPLFASGGSGVVVTASWYGPGFYGNRLPCWQWLQATGKPIQFAPDTWGVAHKTLPCGTALRLTHGANTVIVPVVDRGPYIAGRELDLSLAVKAALGCTDLCTVLMQLP